MSLTSYNAAYLNWVADARGVVLISNRPNHHVCVSDWLSSVVTDTLITTCNQRATMSLSAHCDQRVPEHSPRLAGCTRRGRGGSGIRVET